MARFTAVPADQATGATGDVYTTIKHAIGKVPNAYATLATLAPEALKVMLAVDKVLAGGPLEKADQETVKLIVSELAGCDYCVAAHTLVGKMAGLLPDAMYQLRKGEPTGNERLDALARFVHYLVRNPGTLPQNRLEDLQSAGYTGEQIVYIGLAISMITFTNVFNRVNDTDIDFPKP